MLKNGYFQSRNSATQPDPLPTVAGLERMVMQQQPLPSVVAPSATSMGRSSAIYAQAVPEALVSPDMEDRLHLRQQIDVLKYERDQAEEAMDKMAEDLGDIQKRLNDKEHEVEAKDKEINQLKLDLQNLSASHEARRQVAMQTTESSGKRDELEKEVAAWKDKTQSLTAEVERLKNHVAGTEDALKEANAAKEDALKQATAAKQEETRARSQMTAALAAKETLSKEEAGRWEAKMKHLDEAKRGEVAQHQKRWQDAEATVLAQRRELETSTRNARGIDELRAMHAAEVQELRQKMEFFRKNSEVSSRKLKELKSPYQPPQPFS